MKKTFTANLNGTVFHIEEDAYDQLQRYLANIRAKFSGSAEAEEIMADIEARIAELFTERLQGRQAVSLADVDHVKQVMGQPEDYVDSETADGHAGTEERAYQHYGPTKRKRLFRDPDDRWVAGVMSGLAAYFGTDPLWFRIAFIVVVIAGWGSPVLIYLIMWALVPEAISAAEKLEMHGEEVTVDNIKRVFEEGAERVKAGAEKVAGEAREMGRKYWGQSKDQRYAVRYRAEGVAHRVLDAMGKVVGVFLLFLAIVLGLSLIAALVGGTASWNGSSFTGGTGLMGLMGFIFPSGTHAIGFTLAAIVLGLVPVVMLLLAALWLLFRVRTPRWASWILSTLFILALVLITVLGVRLATDFRVKAVERTVIVMPTPVNRTLDVQLANAKTSTTSSGFQYQRGAINVDMDFLRFDGNSAFLSLTQLNVEQSPDSAYHLVTERTAWGNSFANAQMRAKHIRTDFAWSDDDILRLSSQFSIPIEDKMRAQHVNYVVQIPIGAQVHFAPGTEILMRDRMGDTFGRDFQSDLESDMSGHTWTMTQNGLKKLEDGKGTQPVSERAAPAPVKVLALVTQAPSVSVSMPNLIELLSAGLRP